MESKRHQRATLGSIKTQRSFILPVEMWELIFSNLRRNDLIQCRLVCRSWYTIASSIARRHLVPINTVVSNGNDSRNFDTICNRFQDLRNLPWSACTIAVWNGGSIIRVRKFMEKFGPHIYKLIVQGNSTNSVDLILNNARNLVNLDVSKFGGLLPGRGSFNPRFQNLKGFIATLHDSKSLKFFSLIRDKAGANLHKVHLQILEQSELIRVFRGVEHRKYLPRITSHPNSRGDLLNCKEEFCRLLEGIPHLTLHFKFRMPFKFFEGFYNSNMYIRELKLQIERPLKTAVIGYNLALENLLTRTAHTLKKLCLIDCNETSTQPYGNSTLQIPALPNLRTLELKHSKGRYIGEPLLFYVTQFTANQFPRLEKVHIKVYSYSGDESIFGREIFGTVTQLELEDGDFNKNPMNSKWWKTFPNLLCLHSELRVKGLAILLRNFQKLEHLSLALLDKEDYEGEDVPELDTILSHPTKSLQSFTALKTLQITFAGSLGQQKKRDDFAEKCLLKMKPLDHLYLTNCNISNETKQNLATYHRYIQVYEGIHKRGMIKNNKFMNYHSTAY